MSETAEQAGLRRIYDRVLGRKVADEATIEKRRERGLDDLAAVIEAHYGPRCTRNTGGCVCCSAWAVYDCLDRLLQT